MADQPEIYDVHDGPLVRRVRVVSREPHRLGVRNVVTGRLSYFRFPLNPHRIRPVFKRRKRQ